MFLLLADATSQPGLYSIVLVVGFAIGVYGHIQKSRALILTGIIVVAFVSLYFVAAGELVTGSPLPKP